MVPAKITNLNPVQVTYWKKYKSGTSIPQCNKYIADVENVKKSSRFKCVFADLSTDKETKYRILSLNQPVFIKLTGESKAKIVKI